MDIHAKNGDKVVFKHPTGGDLDQQEIAKKHLVLNRTYTVERTEVGDWQTDVFLKEVPGVAFNSSLFDDAQKRKPKKND